ncbi:hypothetical protein AB4099_18335 [Bosea sp. 2KB_26]|uniref:hypothetical protein n=1 Tax=Bosea sp. 2KB_26 TaxID=3237475 RepID=UPI003F8E9943
MLYRDVVPTQVNGSASVVDRGPAVAIARHLRASALAGALLVLGGSLSSVAAQQPASRAPSDPAVRSAGLKIAGRTFLAASEGNLRGSIYFGPNGQAVQAARDRGTQRLRWGIVKEIKGLSGPAVCLIGDYYPLSAAGSTVSMQRNGQTMTCSAVSSFVRIRSSQGNVLGLGTVIQ